MPSSEATFSNEELLALLRDDSVQPAAIVAEMEDAGASPLAEDILTEARTVLKALGPDSAPGIERLPSTLRSVLVDAAIQLRCADLLTILVQSSDKAMVKEAKRAIHTLKTQGLKVEAPRPTPTASTPAPLGEEKPAVYMTSIDGLGQRVLFFTALARGGMDIAQLMISDELGVVSAELAPLGRKEYRKFLDKLSAARETLVAEVPRAYARGLVARALDLNARARRPVPSTFNDVSFLLGPTVPPQPSPGRELPASEDEALLALHAADLLQLKELRTWAPSESVLVELDKQIEKIGTSTLFIDESQKQTALKELASSSAQAFWTREHRNRHAERLFDMAYLLHLVGRADDSRLALATARALADERPLEAIPYAFAIFERFLPPPKEAINPQPTESPSLIVPG